LVGDLDYPMMVVTAVANGERAGCLVGFATQCSIDPPRFAVWVSRQNHTFAVATEAPILAVHFLSAADAALAELFGGETGDDIDKFDRCDWRDGPGGVPILSDCARWFAGQVVERFPTEDHVGFLLVPVEVETGAWPGQLQYQSVRSIDPGHGA
jgi:flavin reductase (DIM6/NTAB) family NADH-FMN oxidoreductase RutF